MGVGFCILRGGDGEQIKIKHSHTSERTIAYICMPLSNKYVRYCHTNIGNCSFNGAFSLYNADILRKCIKLKNEIGGLWGGGGLTK